MYRIVFIIMYMYSIPSNNILTTALIAIAIFVSVHNSGTVWCQLGYAHTQWHLFSPVTSSSSLACKNLLLCLSEAKRDFLAARSLL